MKPSNTDRAAKVLDRAGLDELFGVLKSRGYTLTGPVVRDGAVVYEEVASTEELPVGVGDGHEPGKYRLDRRKDDALFGYVVGPQSWKKHLFPPEQRLFQVSRNGKSIETSAEEADGRPRALIGVRACELAAMAVQDKVFLGGSFVDPHYGARREKLFIVAVNCGEPASTCFCASIGTGPEARDGFDIGLTELIQNGRHEFFAQAGSERGDGVLGEVGGRVAMADDERRRAKVVAGAVERMRRSMETEGLKELLYRNYESPHWDRVAERCLSCANCTMVCPTCFCSTVEDVTDLSGAHAERWRRWDSCFTMDFSYIVGGSVRPSTSARYRQWMTHKLATWQDQFGQIGCVGCGRCITWCPVGIDITEEAAALKEFEQTSKRTKQEKHDGRQEL